MTELLRSLLSWWLGLSLLVVGFLRSVLTAWGVLSVRSLLLPVASRPAEHRST